MGIEEPSEFELLLAELERATNQLGDATDVDRDEQPTDSVDWLPNASFLEQAPPSLVDFRALGFDDPLSHQMTQPVDLQTAIEPGTVIDQKYEVLSAAARATGGWEARHVVLRQKFIVQLLARSIVDDPIMWPHFQHDIRAAGLLGHENIEFVTDLGRCEQHGAYLVKQWIEGPTLEEWLTEFGKQSAEEAVEFAHAIGGALAALHEIGIIHGRLSPTSIRRVEASDGAIWKLLDVCIPGGDEVLVAPEQIRGEATGPEADQYAIALLAWKLLVGPNGTLEDDPPGAPAELIAVLRTALDDMPLMRWPDLETFVAEMSRAVPTKPKPSIDPFDRREASRLVQLQLDHAEPLSKVAPAAGFEAERPKSMMIRVLPEATTPSVEVDFNTGARLRREYRRNMLAGGLFAPTAGELRVGGRVRVTLRFLPRNAELTTDAMVVSHDPGAPNRPRGFGLAFDVPSRQKIEGFVKNLGLGLGMSPNDHLAVLRPLDASAKLDPGAAFLLSRLSLKTKVGSARAMFAGLPHDFDDCVSALLEQGYVSVVSAEATTPAVRTPMLGARSARKPAPKPKPAPAPAPTPTPTVKRERPISLRSHEWSDVARVLETVEYFEEQGNFMAAGRVLKSATDNAPNVAAYHHRLALMRARFDMDLSAARVAIRRARALEPKNDEFSGAERYIATLIEIAAVRVAWEKTLRGEVRWIRAEPGLGLVWFETKGQKVSLHKVDYLGGSTERTGRAPGWRVVAENAPEFDALEHRRPSPIRSARERQGRQVELGRRFGGLGPHFEREPLATIRTSNSTLDAMTGDGLRIRRGGTQLGQLSDGKARDPVFSPNEQHIAWAEQRADAKWSLHIGPITGPGQCRAVFEGRPKFFWADDSAALIALDTKANTLFSFDRRRGEGKPLLEVRGSLEVGIVRSVDDDSAIVFGRRVVGQSRWSCTWLLLSTGEVLGEYVLPEGAKTGVLRSDGKLALVLKDGRLLVADLNRKIMKPLSTCSPIPASLTGSKWALGSPLLVAEVNGSSARVISIDVDLLCG